MKLIYKLMLMIVVPILLFFLLSYFYIIPQVRNNIYQEKDIQLKSNVESVYSIVGYYGEMADSGIMTKEEAQAKAVEVTSKIRYGKSEYFWIDSTNFINVMHGDQPQAVGTDRSGIKDITGHFNVQEYVAGALANKETGFYENLWHAKPNIPNPLHRRVYAKLYEPWGWVICTGINIDDVEETVAKVTAAIIVANAVLIIVALLFTYWFARRTITRPLEQIIAKLHEMANNGGDLTQTIDVHSNDEIGRLSRTFNDMTQNLRQMIRQVARSSEQVAAASEELTANADQTSQATSQIAASVTDMAAGAADQMTAANETTAVVERMSVDIQHVAANSGQVAARSAQVVAKALDGSKAVGKAVNQMAQIVETVNMSAGVVSKLGERSQEIGQIVDTIARIAGQTNLLALNATIEAARAGEHGRGFAVVAEEVRLLAEQSQAAAKKIAELIGEIQGDTKKAVATMSDGTREVKTGGEVVNAAGASFREIEALVTQVSDQVKEISTAIRHVADSSRQIVGMVKQIDNLSNKSASGAQDVSASTEEQLASMEEIAGSSQVLAKLAEQLQAVVVKFKV